jgi:hypothetical protein
LSGPRIRNGPPHGFVHIHHFTQYDDPEFPVATRLMYAAFGLLEFVLPKRTRSEHWPL